MGTSVHPHTCDFETVEGRSAYARRMLPELRASYLRAFDLAATGKKGADLERLERVMTVNTREAVLLVSWL